MNTNSILDKFPDFYRILFQKSNDSITIFEIDENNNILNFVEANPATEKWTGYLREEILQSSPLQIIAPEKLEEVQKLINIIVSFGFLTFESVIILKDGNRLPVEFSSSFVELNGRRFILTSGREIAERLEINNIREKNIEEKTLLLDILTHDLRNYITILWGCVSETSEKQEPSIEEIREDLIKAKTSLAKIDALIDDISVLMKRDLVISYELEPINIFYYVVKSQTNLEDIFPHKRIKINTSKINAERNVLADRLFEQLLFNIFTNAVKNTEGDEIKIDISTKDLDEKFFILSISDHGKGISNEDRKDIFDRYSEFRRIGKGSGLGLFIIKTLVQRYEGDIWIENTVKDDYTKGTSFKLKLKKA